LIQAIAAKIRDRLRINHYGDQTKQGKSRGTCSTHWGDEETTSGHVLIRKYNIKTDFKETGYEGVK